MGRAEVQTRSLLWCPCKLKVCAKDHAQVAMCFITELHSSCIPGTLSAGPAPLDPWTFLGGLRKDFPPHVLGMPEDCKQSCKHLLFREEPHSFESPFQRTSSLRLDKGCRGRMENRVTHTHRPSASQG